MQKITQSYTFEDGVKACLPTVLGYVGIGLAAGIVGKGAGLSVLEVTLMSLLIYGGSSQFVISGLLLSGASLSSMVLATFLVNFRHLLMSLSVYFHFKEATLAHRVGIGSLLTDESYGVLMTAIQNKEAINTAWVHGLNLMAYITWVVSTAIGALLGSVIPNPEIFGLDFAITAMFIGLVTLQAESFMRVKRRATIIVIITVVVTFIVSQWLLSAEMSVIVATLIGCFMGVQVDESKN